MLQQRRVRGGRDDGGGSGDGSCGDGGLGGGGNGGYCMRFIVETKVQQFSDC
ncbi:MAG: hypothetical protein ABJP93_07680 [Marinobacter sp.]|uniref:hypothetical protein n=1 Tax=Marinobacter sp. TaxID=50741 RepID=UPI003297A9DC